MCLSFQYPNIKQQQLIEEKLSKSKKENTIICWKTVDRKRCINTRLYPLYNYVDTPFDRDNDRRKKHAHTIYSPTRSSYKHPSANPTCYEAYYHLYWTRKAARAARRGDPNRMVVKCEINVADIVTIGVQQVRGPMIAVVAKRFKIIDGNDKYFPQQKEDE